ncbi:hypothetical protein [Soonwooa sp.]|uniref:hypothetical protein n=1 Tax=Soonwooa sp. TaxID=1938592 RepID=UPI0026069F93|nr:hypothetical protein [Soonwooa sp.]
MKKLFYLFILLCFWSCEKKIEHEHGFYYWRTKFNLSKEETKLLSESKVENLYVRFFDLQKSGSQYEAVGVIQRKDSSKISKKIVPVVFITNETWNKISKEDVSFLAQKTFDNIKDISKKLHFDLANEIQIDSDWTAGTKNDYFFFLQELQRISKQDITSTLRLHQVRDKKKMGIPPVKKMYLMCYSTSSPLEKSDKNSILDLKLLKSYLGSLNEYPVKLDVALPIYSWGIVTNHLGKHKLINAVKTEDLENSNFEKIGEHQYKVLKDDFYFGMYLNKGFEIKVEEIPESDIEESINFIDKKLNYPYHIIYYHLDSQFTQHYKNILK